LTALSHLLHPALPRIHPLSLHDALPISRWLRALRRRPTHACPARHRAGRPPTAARARAQNLSLRRRTALHERKVNRAEREIAIRSEEHTSELQSRGHLVCRLLLEKKKKE